MIIRLLLEQLFTSALGVHVEGTAGYFVLAAVAVALLVLAAVLMRRPAFVTRPDQRESRGDAALTAGMVVLAIAVLVPGLWAFGRGLGLLVPLRLAVIAFAVLVALKCGRQARVAVTRSRHARAEMAVVRGLTVAAVLVGLWTAGSLTEIAVRLALPTVAADPHLRPEPRHLTAHDPEVRETVLATPGVADLVEAAVAAVVACLSGPVSVAAGCSGGRHRAATFGIQLAQFLDWLGIASTLTHRDLQKELVNR